MDLFAELKLLVATQVNMPTASGDAFTHCNVEVPLDRQLVMVMVMETLLLLRGSPLCVHSSEGRGTPSKLHIRVKVPSTSNDSKRLLAVVTSGAANIMSRENTITITMLLLCCLVIIKCRVHMNILIVFSIEIHLHWVRVIGSSRSSSKNRLEMQL